MQEEEKRERPEESVESREKLCLTTGEGDVKVGALTSSESATLTFSETPWVRTTMAVFADFSTRVGCLASAARFERAFFGLEGAMSGVDMVPPCAWVRVSLVCARLLVDLAPKRPAFELAD